MNYSEISYIQLFQQQNDIIREKIQKDKKKLFDLCYPVQPRMRVILKPYFPPWICLASVQRSLPYYIFHDSILLCILLANVLPSIVLVCLIFNIDKYIIKYVTLTYSSYYRIVYYKSKPYAYTIK